MKTKCLFLGLILLLLISCSKEDTVEAPAKDTWTTFTDQGLGLSGIYAITQDQEGTIWVGSNGQGLYAFKNNQWTHMHSSATSFIDDTIYALKVDPRGRLWVGSEYGISYFNGVKWFRQYTNIPVLTIEYYPVDGFIYFGMAGAGFGSYKTTFEFWSWGSQYDYINAIYADSKKTAWFGTSGGVVRANYNPASGFSYFRLTTQDGLSTNQVNRIFEDSHQRIWFGFWGGQVVQWLDNGIFQDVNLMSGFDNNYILSIGEDMSGNLWFGAISSGVIKFNGSLMEPFGPKDGICDNTIVSVFRDKDNTLWFGGLEGGITRLQQAIPNL